MLLHQLFLAGGADKPVFLMFTVELVIILIKNLRQLINRMVGSPLDSEFCRHIVANV
jgi:hypothetical protein